MRLYYIQQISLHGFILILLLGLTWTNITSHYFIDDPYSIELFDLFDSESEKEENSEEQVDQNIESNQNLASLLVFNISHQILMSIESHSLHYPEIHTPPPKLI